MSIKAQNFIAILMLLIMFALMITSAWGDSATMDEKAHIPSGYSYVAFNDMRLNPEHPPLMKDLAGIPLLFLNLNFPITADPWKVDLNGQWRMGDIFMYESGNDADLMLRLARFPMMLLGLLLGWMFFSYTRRNFGFLAAFIALFLYVFSPSFIAHSKYVTTDVAASFGFFLGITTFLKFLNYPSRRNLLIAGIGFGIAQLLKFSLILLLPLYAIFAILHILTVHHDHITALSNKRKFFHYFKYGLRTFKKVILIGLIGLVLITALYQFHVYNYPPSKQLADATEILETFGRRWMVDIDLLLIESPILRSVGQYYLGLLMVIQRSVGGNDTFFLGNVAKDAWWYYFPVVYAFKETLALHILTLLSIGLAARNIIKSKNKSLMSIRNWIRDNFIIACSLIFVVFYWGYSMQANLNIGVRHLLPTFPFIFLLVADQISKWLKGQTLPNPNSLGETIKSIYKIYINPLPKYIFLILVLAWMSLSALASWPHYISYFNELSFLMGGKYNIVADSNLDWGQDLKRLERWVRENNVDKIAVHYFGGGSPAYYLGDKFVPWWSRKGIPDGYFAISVNTLQGSQGKPQGRFTRDPLDAYEWLLDKTPVHIVGETILVYKF